MSNVGRVGFGVLAVLTVACGGGDGGDAGDTSITVLAATSLTDAFTDVGEAFNASHPAATVELFFEGSSTLAGQVIERAPADVFASADLTNMAKVVEEGLSADEPAIFATNLLTIVVEAGNPRGIAGIEDLADPDLLVALCEPEQPCRSYSDRIFAAAGMDVPESAQLANVAAVTNAVRTGEADAGIAYVTNVVAAGDDLDHVEIPDALNVPAEYPIATLTGSESPAVARAFVDFVLGADGQSILGAHGFGPAP